MSDRWEMKAACTFSGRVPGDTLEMAKCWQLYGPSLGCVMRHGCHGAGVEAAGCAGAEGGLAAGVQAERGSKQLI